MSEALHHLVYYSRNLVAADRDQMEVEVRGILDASRRNNTAVGITGALLFNEGCFAQVLEGPLEAIEQTFERIQQDPRHGDVSLLALEPISERSFPNWAMGFIGNSAETAARFAKVGAASGFNPALLNGKEIHTILTELAVDEERAAA